MSKAFTKLFSSITESTVWSEPLAVRVVWITMLAMADRYGRVWAAVPGLARRANVTLEEAQAALARFLSADEHSRTPDHDGRRIAEIDGGWRLLNYEKYREMQDEEASAAKSAERSRRYRERQAAMSPVEQSRRVTPRHAQSRPAAPSHPIAEAEAEAEKKKKALSGKPDFDAFYAEYPRKEARVRAESAWRNLKPDLQLVLAAIAWQRVSGCLRDQRTPDGRSLMPLPASWLNAKRWQDERPQALPKTELTAEDRAAFALRDRITLAWGEVTTTIKLKLPSVGGKDAAVTRQAVDRIGGLDALRRLPQREMQDKGASFARAFGEIARSAT